MKETHNHINLILITIAAFVTATTLTTFQSIAAKAKLESQLKAKGIIIISCGNINQKALKDYDPMKDSGNGCAHQQTVGLLSSNSGSKRRMIKPHTC